MSELKFHLAIPAKDLTEAREFYIGILGASEGRSDESWVDFNFFGHQLVFHYVNDFKQKHYFNPVDEHKVPVPHFGSVLEWNTWHALKDNLVKFLKPISVLAYKVILPITL